MTGKALLRRCGPPLFGVLVLVFLFVEPDKAPALWYDEGWTLAQARNWVEHGHYGYYLLGEPVPPTIATRGLPAVAPIAASFRLFGIGLPQGRLPGRLFMLGALAALWYLGARVYGRRAAWATLLVAILCAWIPDVNPVWHGRQVWAEGPMLFYLLVGYVLFLTGFDRPALWPLAWLFWGLTLRTKPQVTPFFAVALLVPLLWSLSRGYRRQSVAFGLGLGGAVGASTLLSLVETKAVGFWESEVWASGAVRVVSNADLLRTYVFVSAPHVRANAMLILGIVGLPLVVGVSSAIPKWLASWREERTFVPTDWVELSLWCFSASWLAWYALLAIAWPRYLFPAWLVGSLYAGEFVAKTTRGVGLPDLVRRAFEPLRSRQGWGKGGAAFLVLVVLPAMTLLTAYGTVNMAREEQTSESAYELARWLGEHASEDAVVETMDSELVFVLDERIHYPPDEIPHLLNRRLFLGEEVEVAYDPLQADPDYLVVGQFGRMWGLYGDAIVGEELRLQETIGPYQIYAQTREVMQ
ncbi:MAG: ArnT family glycosyltransferase [Anaerolineae bacterium]|jgi:hypothetical protein